MYIYAHLFKFLQQDGSIIHSFMYFLVETPNAAEKSIHYEVLNFREPRGQ